MKKFKQPKHANGTIVRVAQTIERLYVRTGEWHDYAIPLEQIVLSVAALSGWYRTIDENREKFTIEVKDALRLLAVQKVLRSYMIQGKRVWEASR